MVGDQSALLQDIRYVHAPQEPETIVEGRSERWAAHFPIKRLGDVPKETILRGRCKEWCGPGIFQQVLTIPDLSHGTASTFGEDLTIGPADAVLSVKGVVREGLTERGDDDAIPTAARIPGPQGQVGIPSRTDIVPNTSSSPSKLGMTYGLKTATTATAEPAPSTAATPWEGTGFDTSGETAFERDTTHTSFAFKGVINAQHIQFDGEVYNRITARSDPIPDITTSLASIGS